MLAQNFLTLAENFFDHAVGITEAVIEPPRQTPNLIHPFADKRRHVANWST